MAIKVVQMAANKVCARVRLASRVYLSLAVHTTVVVVPIPSNSGVMNVGQTKKEKEFGSFSEQGVSRLDQ